MPEFVDADIHEQIRYSQVWEDHRLLTRGLDIGPGDDVLSIASAGCNVAAMLLREPRSIVAIDISPSQCALTELKFAALRNLSAPDIGVLFGARPGDAPAIFSSLSEGLSESTRAFWTAHRGDLEYGIYRCGLLDRAFTLFREKIFAEYPGPIKKLLAARSLDEQRTIFESELATPHLEAAIRQYFGLALAGSGRDESQLRYVTESDIGEYAWNRVRHICTAVPTHDNYYLECLFTGSYADPANGPVYLNPDHVERLRALADRVTVVHASLSDYLDGCAPGTFSKANLSNIFEYCSPAETEALFEQLAHTFRSGGRLAYWNMLVPRSAPAALAGRLRPLRELSRELHRTDRALFYRDFHIDEVQ